MADIRLVREYRVTPARLFEAVTQNAELLQWWGHDNCELPEHQLDFTREGPWFAVMRFGDGSRMKMSGQVTRVDPPRSVGFTWAWHGEDGARGAESHVTFTVEAAGAGARFTVDHRQLQDAEIAARHEGGWNATLSRLDRLMNTEFQTR